jgi:hypothetical protein
MTTPTERTRALLQTGAFLRMIQGDHTWPETTRLEAQTLLRIPRLLG